MKPGLFQILFGFLLIFPSVLSAQSRWSFELEFGVVHSLDLPLIFYQEGYPDIRLAKADFYSEPLIDPPHWDWRFSKWFKNKSIELEGIHHKFYLRNTPPEVYKFGVSHGYNMFFVNHSREIGKFILRMGIGSALVHAESTIRGMEYQNGPGFDFPGYRIRGVCVNLGIARQFKISKTFFVNAEAKVNASVANIPIVSGHARMHVVAFQLVLGPGVNWCVREKPMIYPPNI